MGYSAGGVGVGGGGWESRLDSGDKGYGFLPPNTINLLTLRKKETLTGCLLSTR